MPELPEVETVRRGLVDLLSDQPRIESVQKSNKKLRQAMPRDLNSKLSDQSIRQIRRRAKFLLFDTEDFTLVSHLGMTGSWRLAPKGDERTHDHCYLNLSQQRRLAYHDPRRFGLIEIFKKGSEQKSKWLKTLGPEPLGETEFSADYLFKRSRKKVVAAKTFIMDQKVVVGVGNIYASEALFRAGVRPGRAAKRLTQSDCKDIVASIREVLDEAIIAGGTTLKDFRQAGGSEGYFQVALKVYGRGGQPCQTCGQPIRHKVLTGRSTYWCSTCQRT